MNQSIRCELLEYINERVGEMRSSDSLPLDISDIHHEIFNMDYYIIGYYEAEEWLKSHNVSPFKALSKVREYELFHFGETNDYDNAEKLVNMIVYIIGEELIYELEDKILTI
jgi:hypothetical protein